MAEVRYYTSESLIEEVRPESFIDEVKPEDVPLPTSSMITVRLSDYQSDGEERATDTPNESPRNSGHSLASRPRSISVASSRSSTTMSSEESGPFSPVDWDELEKTEEQEPKDEGTDDVSGQDADIYIY